MAVGEVDDVVVVVAFLGTCTLSDPLLKFVAFSDYDGDRVV